MQKEYNRDRIFLICVLALFSIALGVALRASIASEIKTTFFDPIDITQSATMIAEVLGITFLGFAISLFVTSPILDIIRVDRALLLTCGLIFSGNLIIIFAGELGVVLGVYWAFFLGMLLHGVAWGIMEASINPVTAVLFPDEKTHRLNLVHAWWPGGLIIGGLLGLGLNTLGVGWQASIVPVFIPATICALLIIGERFPETTSTISDIKFQDMLKEVFRRPTFFIWFGAMFLTAASELAPGQWVDLALTHTVGMRGIILLIYVSAIMFVLRHFAGPITNVISPVALLWFSALFAAVGLYSLSIANSPMTAFLAATIWGVGVCFMWPTMLACVAERYPRGGAWTIGLTGSAGALSAYLVLPILGAAYDQAKLEAAGGKAAFEALNPGTNEHTDVLVAAAEHSFQVVAILPLVLLMIFGGILYSDHLTKRKKRRTTQSVLDTSS